MNDSIPNWVKQLIESSLELPNDPAFVSVPGSVSVREMVRISELYLPISNSRPDFIESRLARKFDDPFEL